MTLYPTSIGGDIGSLLRLIQEEKQKQLVARPGVAPGEISREIVHQPLVAPESPGTARIVSERPEAIVGPQAPVRAAGITPVPRRAAIGPVRIGGPGEVVPAVTAPGIKPEVPTPLSPEAPSPSFQPSAPTVNQPSISPPSVSLGTQIMAKPSTPIPTSTPAPAQPAQPVGSVSSWLSGAWSPQQIQQEYQKAQQKIQNVKKQMEQEKERARQQQAAVANIPRSQAVQVKPPPQPFSLGTIVSSLSNLVKKIFKR